LQPAKYFSRNSTKDEMNNTTRLINDSYATTLATPGVILSSQLASNSTNMHPAVFQRRNINKSVNLSEANHRRRTHQIGSPRGVNDAYADQAV